MILLTLRDLAYRKVRFALVTALVAVVLALLFVMTGISNRFEVEPYDSVDAIGAPYWVVPAGSSGPFTASGTVATDIAPTLGVAGVQPVVVARASLSKTGTDHKEVVLIGVAAGALGSPEVVKGTRLAGIGEAVVDREAGVHVGDQVTIAGQPVTVVGLTSGRTIFAGAPLAFMEVAQVQDVVFNTDTVASALLVPERPATVPEGYELRTADEVAKDALKPIKNAVSSITLMLVLLWLVAAIVIGAIVFLSALERTRDFAVLKAMGSPDRVLAGGLAVQAVLVAIVAALAAALLQRLLHPAFPLGVEVPSSAYWQVPVVAVAVALVSALLGVRRVINADPTQAFGGPGA